MAESTGGTQTANGSDARKTALRAAAIAAASGATAIAARKAFSQGSQSDSSTSNGGGSSTNDSLLGGMAGAGWGAARDAIVPFAADAARAGGEYLAKNGPDFMRDTVVPSFIEGFQGAEKSDDD